MQDDLDGWRENPNMDAKFHDGIWLELRVDKVTSAPMTAEEN